ncbi:hypothetical protein A9974_08090 [Achromobacter sp. UMC71]|nr:hypothetical protein [Achromobacter sp. UMC71]
MNGPTNWSRPFLADQAHMFLAVERDNGATMPGPRDNHLLERCTAHLMAVANCSQRTAETEAAKAIAEVGSHSSPINFDMDRSTSHALFIVDRATGHTRVLSSIEVAHLLSVKEVAALAI